MNERHRKKLSVAILAVLIAGAGMLLSAAGMALLQPETSEPSLVQEDADLVAYKRANCTCCAKWIAHLRENGLVVSVRTVSSTLPIQERLGVPEELRACHTAETGDYWVEGHVPAETVKRLIIEQPNDVAGFAVPGMPIGSPGMEGPNPERYSVMRVSPEGEVSVYARRGGAGSAE